MCCRYGLKPGSAVLAEEKHQPVYAELVKDYKVCGATCDMPKCVLGSGVRFGAESCCMSSMSIASTVCV